MSYSSLCSTFVESGEPEANEFVRLSTKSIRRTLFYGKSRRDSLGDFRDFRRPLRKYLGWVWAQTFTDYISGMLNFVVWRNQICSFQLIFFLCCGRLIFKALKLLTVACTFMWQISDFTKTHLCLPYTKVLAKTKCSGLNCLSLKCFILNLTVHMCHLNQRSDFLSITRVSVVTHNFFLSKCHKK